MGHNYNLPILKSIINSNLIEDYYIYIGSGDDNEYSIYAMNDLVNNISIKYERILNMGGRNSSLEPINTENTKLINLDNQVKYYFVELISDKFLVIQSRMMLNDYNYDICQNLLLFIDQYPIYNDSFQKINHIGETKNLGDKFNNIDLFKIVTRTLNDNVITEKLLPKYKDLESNNVFFKYLIIKSKIFNDNLDITNKSYFDENDIDNLLDVLENSMVNNCRDVLKNFDNFKNRLFIKKYNEENEENNENSNKKINYSFGTDDIYKKLLENITFLPSDISFTNIDFVHNNTSSDILNKNLKSEEKELERVRINNKIEDIKMKINNTDENNKQIYDYMEKSIACSLLFYREFLNRLFNKLVRY